MVRKYPFWKPFFVLFLSGMIGVLSLVFITVPQLDNIRVTLPDLAELPVPLLVMILLLQPAVLLLIASAIGCLLAPRLDLVSLLYERAAYGTPVLPRLKPQLKLALVLGLILAVVIMALDWAFLPFLGEEISAIETQGFNLLALLVMGMFYGGITEELLLRWGFMSILVWLGWLLLRRSGDSPPAGLVWVAIFIASIVFGIGHLPAMAAMVPLTAIIAIRTIVLNSIAGIVFGWLYWRRSLEAAMVSHAFVHVGFFIIRLFSLAFN